MKKNLSARRILATVEWPTFGLIVATYFGWFAAGFWLWPVAPMLALVAMAMFVALHSSLMHEASHGHPTRNTLINEALVFLPLGLAWPYRRFKTLHLRHHADDRLTDPFDDPESYYQAFWKYEAMPAWLQTLLAVNNTMVGRLVLGAPLAIIGLFLADAKAMREGDSKAREAWALHILGLLPVLALIQFGFGIPVWLYVITAAWAGLSIISIRTYAEHRWNERPDGRTIIVERSPLSLLFLNNNLHLVHHKHPQVAWYQLPRLFRQHRAKWIAMNGGYVVPNYWALFRAYAFRAKEPVVHPVLRRQAEPGRAFRPQMRPNAVQTGAAAPVPAKPQKD